MRKLLISLFKSLSRLSSRTRLQPLWGSRCLSSSLFGWCLVSHSNQGTKYTSRSFRKKDRHGLVRTSYWCPNSPWDSSLPCQVCSRPGLETEHFIWTRSTQAETLSHRTPLRLYPSPLSASCNTSLMATLSPEAHFSSAGPGLPVPLVSFTVGPQHICMIVQFYI